MKICNEIKDEDINIEVYKITGAGGQHCGWSNSVKITHIPTGIVVKSEYERSQHKNKEVALKMLKSRLFNPCEVFEKLIPLEKVCFKFNLLDVEDEIWWIETPFLGLYNDLINLYFSKKSKDLYHFIQDAGSNAEHLKDKRIQNILNSLDVKVVDERLALSINLKEASIRRMYSLINVVIQVNSSLTFLKGGK